MFRYRLTLPVRFVKAGTVDLPGFKTIGEKFEPFPEFYNGTKKKKPIPEGNWAPMTLVTAPLKVQVGEKAAE